LPSHIQGWKKSRFIEKVFTFSGFKSFLLDFNVYEDRTQNYDPEIHEEYLIHDTPFLLPPRAMACADYSVAINTKLKDNNFLL